MIKIGSPFVFGYATARSFYSGQAPHHPGQPPGAPPPEDPHPCPSPAPSAPPSPGEGSTGAFLLFSLFSRLVGGRWEERAGVMSGRARRKGGRGDEGPGEDLPRSPRAPLAREMLPAPEAHQVTESSRPNPSDY